MPASRIALAFGLTAVLTLLVCCEQKRSAPVEPMPVEPRTEDSQGVDSRSGESAAREADPTPEPVTAEEPAEPVAQPEQNEIAMDEPAEEAEPLPPYIAITDSMNAAKPVDVVTVVEKPRRLRVMTSNVRTLRLTREQLPLMKGVSIILVLDDQGIEWTPEFTAIELERTKYGEWTVTKRRPSKP